MNDPRDERLDYDDLSDAERAAIEGNTDTGAAPAPAPAPTPEPTPTPTPADDSATHELREAASALTAAAQALQQSQAQTAAQQQPAAQETAAAPRDFNAELVELETRYDDGQLDMKEFLRARDEVNRAQVAAEMAQQLSAQQQQQAHQDWASAYVGFFSGAEAEANARLATDALKPGFDALAVRLVAEGKGYHEALTEARRVVFEQVGIPLPGAVSRDDAVAKALKDRQPGTRPGPSLGDLPTAAGMATGAAEQLDSLPIEEMEARIARMSPTELEEFLASAEGGLRDYPRAGRG